MLPMDFIVSCLLPRFVFCVLVIHFWSYLAATMAIPAVALTLIVLNSRIDRSLERGCVRRRTDGHLSAIHLESLFIAGELVIIGGIVLMFLFLHVPLNIRNFIMTAARQ